MCILQCYVKKGEEPIAAGQKTANKHLLPDMMQYEIEHLAIMRNNSADELSNEHGS